jgi:hypothetical protein
MRWLVCCLMLPLSAGAASVLLIPVDEKARALADDLIEPFGAVSLTVKMAGPGSPALNCLKDAARDACLGTIGGKAKVVAVFVVSGALKGGKGTLTLEMLSKGVVVKKDSFKVQKGKVKTQMKGPIAALIKLLPKPEATTPVEQPKVTAVVETPKDPDPVEPPVRDPDPPKVVDVPKKIEPVALTPSKPPDDLGLKSKPLPAKKPKVGAWVVTGLAIAAAGAGGTFGALGFMDKGRLETAPDGVSTLSYREAQALQQKSNLELTVGLGAGIGAGVAGVLAAILWGAE